MATYQPNIPTGTVNLDVDYQNIQGNFQSLDTIFGIDHVPYSNTTAEKGYHTSIHMNPVSTTATNPPDNQPVSAPAVVAGIGQIFSASITDGVNTDTALYFLTGGNRLQQLTRNFAPVASTDGYTFLPGGLIFQWGTKTGMVSGANAVTFPLPFPTSAFNVILQPIRVATSNVDQLYVLTGSVSKTGFTITNTSSSIPTCYWMAIGI